MTSWLVVVKNWHDEEKNYDWGTGKSANGKVIGHFTQVVWKKATKLGCGKSLIPVNGKMQPFYIAQMDVVGIVGNKEELGLVGRPKQVKLIFLLSHCICYNVFFTGWHKA